MKIVLSRKGVDSSSGGFASPIIDGDRLVPVAIPDARSPIRYRDLQHDVAIGPLIKHLSNNRLNGWSRVHLDPDLRKQSVKKRQLFTPLFGQCGAAQTHLASHGIGVGDLFLFFGWFRKAEMCQRRWRYVPGAPDLHVIFGWLQVEKVLSVYEVLTEDCYATLRAHPHCFGEFSGDNTLYVGRQELSLNRAIEGAGFFDTVSANRTLTAHGCRRSQWALPRWMYPQSDRSSLSYHHDKSRWTREGEIARLQSVARGQEFVLDSSLYPEAPGWLADLFSMVD